MNFEKYALFNPSGWDEAVRQTRRVVGRRVDGRKVHGFLEAFVAVVVGLKVSLLFEAAGKFFVTVSQTTTTLTSFPSFRVQHGRAPISTMNLVLSILPACWLYFERACVN